MLDGDRSPTRAGAGKLFSGTCRVGEGGHGDRLLLSDRGHPGDRDRVPVLPAGALAEGAGTGVGGTSGNAERCAGRPPRAGGGDRQSAPPVPARHRSVGPSPGGGIDPESRDHTRHADGHAAGSRSSARRRKAYSRTVMDTIGLTGGLSPVEPENGLLEKLKTPPSSATIR